jgi:tetratricopeptide (TPR) repeat protein
MGDYPAATADLKLALAMNPMEDRARLHLAWMYACIPDDAVRSGETALKLLSPILDKEKEEGEFNRFEFGNVKREEKSQHTVLSMRETEIIAAAMAESGDFKRAIKYQRSAVDLAESEEETGNARERLALFEAGKPYRLPVKKR